MRGVAFWFLLVAALCALLGMVSGVVMAAAQDHSLSPAHAHLNLLGWVSMAIFGFYYHLVPEASARPLARLHLCLSITATILFTPGIILAIRGQTEVLAQVGALLTIASMLVFLVTVARHRSTDRMAKV